MKNNFKWGIIGTGGIAGEFANDLSYLNNHTVAAVGSRKLSTAQQFASKYPDCVGYASYSELVADPNLDGIYIATPQNFHVEHTILALDAGKPVLCEKPFAINTSEVELMVKTATQNQLTLIEAMWTRFLPHIEIVRKIINSNVLGNIHTLQADHGQRLSESNKPRLWDPALGGGALLDLGIYVVSFAHLILGVPDKITAKSNFTDKGVDEQTSAIFEYKNGAQAILNTTLRNSTPCRAVISGVNGWLEIDRTFYNPAAMRVVLNDGTKTEYPNNYKGHGLREQAIEFSRCVGSKLIESPLMPHEESIAVMRSMDKIREQIGLHYPNEKL
jgi:predicted dehydrogenase